MHNEDVTITTRLAGQRQVTAGLQTEAAAMEEVGAAAATTGAEMEVASRRTFLMNQALFTLRRFAYMGTLALVGAGLAALKLGWDYTSAMQQARVALQPVFKNTQALNTELDTLFRRSAFTPFQYKDITIAFRQMFGAMRPLGISADYVNTTLFHIIDALSFVGRTSPGALNRVSVALQHMAFMGRLTGQVVLQLARDGLPIYPALQKELGLTADQVHNIGKAGIDSKMALKALNDYIATAPGFRGAATRQATGTLHGAFTTFRDLLSQALGGAQGGTFGFLQHMLQQTDLALAPFYNSKKPVTLTEIANALDHAVSPNTHLVINLFTLLDSTLHGVLFTFGALAAVIRYAVLIPLGQLLAFTHLNYVAFHLLGYVLGFLIATYAIYKARLLAVALIEELDRARTWTLALAKYSLATATGTARAAMMLYELWVLRAEYADLVAARATKILTAAMFYLEYASIAVTDALEAATFWIQFQYLVALEALPGVMETVALYALYMWDALLGPVGWALAILTTLGLLYWKVKAFRDAVNDAWNFLKQHWAVLSFLPVIGQLATLAQLFVSIYHALQGIYNVANHPIRAIQNSGKGSFIRGAAHDARTVLHYLGVPGAAAGGTVLSGGSVLVGENGPEILSLPRGATIQPLGEPSFDWAQEGFGGINITVGFLPINIDGRKVAEAQAQVVTDQAARQ